MGTHVSWAFAAAIWLYLVLGFIRPFFMDSWAKSVPFGIFPHLEWTNNFSLQYGNLFYNPFHALSIVFLYGSALSCMARRSLRSVAMAANASLSRLPIGVRHPSVPPVWRWTMGFNEEVRLNQRLAPEFYLGVMALTGSPDAPRFGGDGGTIEYAVKMRQFPPSAQLDRMLDQGKLEGHHLDAFARLIAAFHQRVSVAGVDLAHGEPERVLAPAIENFPDLARSESFVLAGQLSPASCAV